MTDALEAGDLRDLVARLAPAAPITEAVSLTATEREALRATACGNCGERTAVLNLAARIKAEAVQTERERIAREIERLRPDAAMPSPLSYRIGRTDAARIARGES